MRLLKSILLAILFDLGHPEAGNAVAFNTLFKKRTVRKR